MLWSTRRNCRSLVLICFCIEFLIEAATLAFPFQGYATHSRAENIPRVLVFVEAVGSKQFGNW